MRDLYKPVPEELAALLHAMPRLAAVRSGTPHDARRTASGTPMIGVDARGSNGAAGPFLIVASHDEVQRLALRGIDAIERLGSHESVDPYRGRLALATPMAVRARGDVAGVLHASDIEVRYLAAGFDIERDDPAEFVGERVFKASDPPQDQRDRAGAAAGDSGLRVLNLSELLTYQFPEREPILAPWLLTQSLALIYAWRGVGKTHVALGIAYAIATGGKFLMWEAPVPRRVLYLDGEMPGAAMQERLRDLVLADERDFDPDFLQIVTPDAQSGHSMPDLATEDGQAAVDRIGETHRSEVIIVDNISTLCRDTGAENEAESWREPQGWALRQRQAGRSVVFIHHEGKSGKQRGSSKREDTLDVSIRLKHPADYSPDQGARFEIHFEKYRPAPGSDDVRPIEATLIAGQDGRPAWTWRSVDDSTFDRVVALYGDGLKAGEIATELDVNKSTVSRHLKKARDMGLVVERKP